MSRLRVAHRYHGLVRTLSPGHEGTRRITVAGHRAGRDELGGHCDVLGKHEACERGIHN